jgi:hypothetical protein
MMADMVVATLAHRAAFEHVVMSIHAARAFPAQVFLGAWGAFLFFESDRLFAPGFATTARDLLRAERASVCCLVNFSKSPTLTYENGAKLFLDATSQPNDYDVSLREGGPVVGWLFGMDRYGCASDAGDWSIYCEKDNDVGVIALRRAGDMEKYVEALSHLHAAPISILLAAGSSAPVPFCQLTETWRRGLTEHYTCGTNQEEAKQNS